MCTLTIFKLTNVTTTDIALMAGVSLNRNCQHKILRKMPQMVNNDSRHNGFIPLETGQDCGAVGCVDRMNLLPFNLINLTL